MLINIYFLVLSESMESDVRVSVGRWERSKRDSVNGLVGHGVGGGGGWTDGLPAPRRTPLDRTPGVLSPPTPLHPAS